MRYQTERLTLEERFWLFHADNLHVYDKLLEIARFVRLNTKKTTWGIAAIFERLRWLSEFETEGDRFKLNNNHKAFYARMLMEEPGLTGFFKVREQKSARQV